MTDFPELRGKKIFVIDDDRDNLESLGRVLRLMGCDTVLFSSPLEGVRAVESDPPHVIITDMKMPEMDGMEVLRRVREVSPSVPVIVLTAYGSIGGAVEAIREGAADYLQKPIDVESLKGVLLKALRTRGMMEELESLREKVVTGAGPIVYRSRAMERIMDMVRTVAPTKANVLILGESGTGKELIARAIHDLSPRKEKPFIPINCAALSESLLESELFGHEKGAFTGAVSTVRGKFELAQGGTIFLDEIGDMPLSTQAKILRAIEQREIIRLGGEKIIRVDVRVISATNADLKSRVEEKKFREDLYYRLSVFTIRVPPLRERKEDVRHLLFHFGRLVAEENGLPWGGFAPEVVEICESYSWPGNVRELRNAVETMVLLSGGGEVKREHVPREILDAVLLRDRSPIPVPGRASETEGVADEVLPLQELEKRAIVNALKATGNNKTKAAKLLGIGLRTLYRKVKEYGIEESSE
ncbi:MAG: sigma-54-dependent Fis family transcriptional regulator [Deltaproteobacteria bacterium]|nr:MAG: sigma-54-dependent Fis family transcriptional regulator [Deltaproteobacteria bacterium]